MRAFAFDIPAVDAVIADERIGHCDDLPFVGRIGQNFLIAGHGSVEDDFTFGRTGCAKGFAGENASIFEREFCDCGHGSNLIQSNANGKASNQSGRELELISPPSI